jgi:hypothetical protein
MLSSLALLATWRFNNSLFPMTHPLVTFDLQIVRPVHSATQRLCGYVVRLKGIRLVHFVMRLEDCSELHRFRKFLLSHGSFHFAMGSHELADFLQRCFNASESSEPLSEEEAEAEVVVLNAALVLAEN